jgi:5-methylcytosine-specific restriction endonuclease McrA
MLFLNTETLNPGEVSALKTLQGQVDAESTFDDQAKTAKRLWEAESSKTPFREIRKVLLRMCVGVGICNYCENNEATDIEHILPKSFFPQAAFRWENYLLACKTCNSGYKLDKLAVFFPETPCTKYIVAKKPNRRV